MSNLRAPVLAPDLTPVGEVLIEHRDGRYSVSRSRFVNEFNRELTEAQADRVRVSALAHNWDALHAFDAELLPWYCPSCRRNYAESQWEVFPRFDSEGHWLDSYRGRCPNRHERMIAD
jgi:hypothetical protein